MGKRIIIKNVDFSANALPSTIWYADYDEELMNGGSTFINTNKFPLAPISAEELNLDGKTINIVKFYSAAAGTCEFGNVNINDAPRTYSNSQSVDVVAGINTIILETPLQMDLENGITIYVSGKSKLTFKQTAVEVDSIYGWKYLNINSGVEKNRIPIALGFTTEDEIE